MATGSRARAPVPRTVLLCLWALAALVVIAPRGAPALPSRPVGWPATLELGMADSPGGAPALRASTGSGFRYQDLAGGVDTGQGWATWNPDGRFVTFYIQESAQQGVVPVFSYYMLLQSAPGGPDEGTADSTNLQNAATMAAYYGDLKLFFQRAGEFPGVLVVLHVEPDLWGYMQQRTTGDDAASIPARVASTGFPELAGLPENLSGFARAIVALRDAYAPNVRLGYHLSVWGTGNDIAYSDPPDSVVDALALRAATFFRSLRAPFDVVFGEFSDRDAGFKQYVWGDGGASWWDAADFARHVRFLGGFVAAADKRVVLWQIPLGNTRMRAMNNTWNHYQDNRVEWLLDDPGRGHLLDYLQAGVIALLFGRGADGATCACDAAGDGITDPAPIDGNTQPSLTADDDGGFFRAKAAAYYAAGALPLDGPSALALSVSTNAGSFAPGETLVLSVTVENPGLPTSADFYFGVLLPDGGTLVSFVDPQFHAVATALSDAGSLPPMVRGVGLDVAFTAVRQGFLSYTWTGAEPVGRYVFFLAAARPGGLSPANLLAVGTAAITVAGP